MVLFGATAEPAVLKGLAGHLRARAELLSLQARGVAVNWIVPFASLY